MNDVCPSCKVHRGHRAGCSLSGAAPLARDLSIEAYREFLRAKCELPQDYGVPVEPGDVHPWLKPHQRAGVVWGVRGGRRALFEAFGLGKTVQQLEIERLILKHFPGDRGLIVAPLGVRQEFEHDADTIGVPLRFIRSMGEASAEGIYLTNYESVRDGKIDPAAFRVASLDEASVLRGFGGTKTFREFMRLFAAVPYRYVATATPDPNEYIELLAYAAFLGIMDVSQAKTRFFKRDATKADVLTLHPHKGREFWLWVASWAFFLRKPSDLGPEYSDEGYDLPPLQVIHHEVQVDHAGAEPERDGQERMFREATHGVVDAAREKRTTLPQRVGELRRILEAEPEEHFLLWHDLEAERHAIEDAVPAAVSVYGAQRSGDPAALERAILDFSNGRIRYLAAKPSMFGAGANFQRHCARAVFCGIGFRFHDFIQAIHRIYRFLQPRAVQVHLIYAESERTILASLLEKWERHKVQSDRMAAIIQEFGLSQVAMTNALRRSMGADREEVAGDGYCLANNDCVDETERMTPESVDLVLTSIPFSTQYEYSPNYADFGHTDSNEHFFEQMDFLTPRLLRVLKPGRLAAIHVKDRIVPGGITGLGFQTVYPFHARCIEHFTRHGFAFIGMKTIVTDVVRENNQTYRLGWTEQCKDGSKMGFGMPEYLLLFRKPPSDTTNSYADAPVVKQKAEYSRSRWQIDAHGFARSSGNRPLMPADLDGLPHHAIFKRFRQHSLTNVYDFEGHVRLGEALEAKGILPVTFMLLQPQSWHPDVWSDVTRMRTLNGAQSAKGKEMHLCPMQFDIAERSIAQWTMPGETVYDPFGGLMTVPYCAVQLGRRGIGVELNPGYFYDGCAYVQAAAKKANAPTLFDALENEAELPAEDLAS
jgi:DNA modification methylase